MISTSRSIIKPEQLPPTTKSAFFHSFRVHLQTILWETLDIAALDPLLSGWKKTSNGILTPIPNNDVVAPENMLKYQCKCKVITKNPYSTNICSCCITGCVSKPAEIVEKKIVTIVKR